MHIGLIYITVVSKNAAKVALNVQISHSWYLWCAYLGSLGVVTTAPSITSVDCSVTLLLGE